jgi:uncharacterized protein (DUF302 family)
MYVSHFEAHLGVPQNEAVELVVNALKEHGFGVLTRIDIHQALNEKLGVDFRPYTILGACNPQLAHRALLAVPEVGLLLPCNVTVEETAGTESLVRIIDPIVMMESGGLGESEALKTVATEARERLQRVAESLSVPPARKAAGPDSITASRYE